MPEGALTSFIVSLFCRPNIVMTSQSMPHREILLPTDNIIVIN